MYLLKNQDPGDWPDPNTDPRLLPGWMLQGDNSPRRDLYRTAVRLAMERFLTPEQQFLVHMRFWGGMSMAEIGGALGITGSGAAKRLRGVLNLLKIHATFCSEVWDALERHTD